MSRSFAVTFDYLCPFARNAFEAIAAGQEAGRDWDVRYVPFSLSQAHVPEGEQAAWDRENGDRYTSGVLALQWGLAVRDNFPDKFPAFHLAMFAARHDHAQDLKDATVLSAVAENVGLDPRSVQSVVAGEGPRETLMTEHVEAVEKWRIFGVPTFIQGDDAVFVRLMERGRVDDLEQVLTLLSATRLNEFKRTVVPR